MSQNATASAYTFACLNCDGPAVANRLVQQDPGRGVVQTGRCPVCNVFHIVHRPTPGAVCITTMAASGTREP